MGSNARISLHTGNVIQPARDILPRVSWMNPGLWQKETLSPSR